MRGESFDRADTARLRIALAMDTILGVAGAMGEAEIDATGAATTPPTDGSVTFVPLAAGHEADWRRLWTGFAAALTGTAPADEAMAQTWRWLCDPAHPLEGLVAVAADGQPVGLAQFYAVARPLMGRESGYLADLYVDPPWRGRGIGQALFAAVMDIGRARGWAKFRWVTPADNHGAVALYDRIARRVPMVVYDFDL
ncbi:MAG: N-acetyltransferase family protein [Alphaproteobacteria bacterium]